MPTMNEPVDQPVNVPGYEPASGRAGGGASGGASGPAGRMTGGRGRGPRRTAAALTAGAAALVLALTGCNGSGGSGSSGGSNDAKGHGGLFDKATPTASRTAPAQSGIPTGIPTGTASATVAAPQPPASPPAPAPGQLPSRLEADGTTITVGNPAARHTIMIDEDPRCPICARFEKTNGAKLTALAAAGKVRLQYTLASFLDDTLGGSGSKRAVNALRAAVDENRFAPLHTLVYARQPAETQDGFTVQFLLGLADGVQGLRTPYFDAVVRGQTYASFVSRSEHAFLASGATGTPTIAIDGVRVTGDVTTAAGFEAALVQHGLA